MSAPSEDEQNDLLLSCRYGDLEDIQHFITTFGTACIADIRDDNANTVLHMAAGNGHIDVLNLLLTVVPPRLIGALNNAASSPLHWAALNAHLDVARALVQFPGGPGVDLIDGKNAVGRTPLGEAEMAGWEDGARWFVEVMRLDADEKGDEELHAAGGVQDIEVEIEDADGGVAKMSISGDDVVKGASS